LAQATALRVESEKHNGKEKDEATAVMVLLSGWDRKNIPFDWVGFSL